MVEADMHDPPLGETTVGCVVHLKQDRFGLSSYPRRMTSGSIVPSGLDRKLDPMRWDRSLALAAPGTMWPDRSGTWERRQRACQDATPTPGRKLRSNRAALQSRGPRLLHVARQSAARGLARRSRGIQLQRKIQLTPFAIRVELWSQI